MNKGGSEQDAQCLPRAGGTEAARGVKVAGVPGLVGLRPKVAWGEESEERSRWAQGLWSLVLPSLQEGWLRNARPIGLWWAGLGTGPHPCPTH